MLSSAEVLKAIRRGWSVIPIKPRSKAPLGNWKARQRTRSTNEETKALFHTTPDVGLGFVTGGISDLIVLDIDPDAGGEQSMNALVL